MRYYLPIFIVNLSWGKKMHSISLELPSDNKEVRPHVPLHKRQHSDWLRGLCDEMGRENTTQTEPQPINSGWIPFNTSPSVAN